MELDSECKEGKMFFHARCHNAVKKSALPTRIRRKIDRSFVTSFLMGR